MATDPSGPEGDDAESDGDGEEWRFSLADIEAREGKREADGDEDIEAGDIDVENAVFVLVGVVLAVLVLAGFANVLP